MGYLRLVALLVVFAAVFASVYSEMDCPPCTCGGEPCVAKCVKVFKNCHKHHSNHRTSGAQAYDICRAKLNGGRAANIYMDDAGCVPNCADTEEMAALKTKKTCSSRNDCPNKGPCKNSYCIEAWIWKIVTPSSECPKNRNGMAIPYHQTQELVATTIQRNISMKLFLAMPLIYENYCFSNVCKLFLLIV